MFENKGIPITIVNPKSFRVLGRGVIPLESLDIEKITRLGKERFSLEGVLKHEPDIYAENVLSHGFMNFAQKNGTYIAIQSRIRSEQGSYDPKNPEHTKLWLRYVKEEYLAWARQNHQPEYILDAGWEAFVND